MLHQTYLTFKPMKLRGLRVISVMLRVTARAACCSVSLRKQSDIACHCESWVMYRVLRKQSDVAYHFKSSVMLRPCMMYVTARCCISLPDVACLWVMLCVTARYCMPLRDISCHCVMLRVTSWFLMFCLMLLDTAWCCAALADVSWPGLMRDVPCHSVIMRFTPWCCSLLCDVLCHCVVLRATAWCYVSLCDGARHCMMVGVVLRCVLNHNDDRFLYLW